jgi:mono/diheme cytochrome c family protein
MIRTTFPIAVILALLFGIVASASQANGTPHVVADSQLDAGRYIVLTAGCNHCHTQGWEASNGTLAQSKWLLGGHAPPDVPTPDIRVLVHALPQTAFVGLFRAKHPDSAMPWFDMRNFSDADLQAIYAFIRGLK